MPYKCQEKRKQYLKKYYERNKEVFIAKAKLRSKSTAGKKARVNRYFRYIRKYPEKYKAHLKLRDALRKGILTKQPCEICGGTEDIEAHHDDYSKPLEVIWLCKNCHRLFHRFLNYLSKEVKQ
jgi:hypothetical protein